MKLASVYRALRPTESDGDKIGGAGETTEAITSSDTNPSAASTGTATVVASTGIATTNTAFSDDDIDDPELIII